MAHQQLNSLFSTTGSAKLTTKNKQTNLRRALKQAAKSQVDLPQPQKGTDLYQVYQAQKRLALATDNLKAGNRQLALTLTKLENQNTTISKLSVASQKIKHTKNQQISQAFSHTYLVGAVIVLILSPIALLTDRKSLKS